VHARVFSFFFAYARFGKNKLLPVSGAVLVPGGTGRDGVAAAAMGYRGSARTVLLMLMTRARRIEQRLVVVHVLCVLAVLLAHVPRHGLRQPLAHRCRRPAVRSCQSPRYKIQSPLLGHSINCTAPSLSQQNNSGFQERKSNHHGWLCTDRAGVWLSRSRSACTCLTHSNSIGMRHANRCVSNGQCFQAPYLLEVMSM
jgi:hypothetical protein